MNTLPSFARTCARRTVILPSSSITTSSTLSSITKSHFHRPQQSRSLSTTPSTTEATSPDLPPPANLPSTTTTSSPPSSTSTPLSTTSPYLLTGIVSRVGTMTHCIQITRHLQRFNPHLQKHYTRPVRMLIHDPNPAGFLSEGDVVEFGLFSEAERNARLERKKMWEEKERMEVEVNGKRKGGRKQERTKWRGPKMVVRRVVSAFGVGVEERMERIVRMQEEGKGDEVLKPAGKKGRVGKQHGSAKVRG